MRALLYVTLLSVGIFQGAGTLLWWACFVALVYLTFRPFARISAHGASWREHVTGVVRSKKPSTPRPRGR